ncbi:MAG: NfeD family protein [Oscillospiraceae bacterium]
MNGIFAEIGIMPFMWLAVAASFFVLEAVTVQFVSIWLGLGAIVAIIPSVMKVPFHIQFLVFVVASVVFILLTRPFVKNIVNAKKVYRTNADSVIGMEAIVIEKINNLNGSGRVKVAGLDWAARSSNGQIIEEGQCVTIEAIEGVKVIVTCKSLITIE